MRFFRGAFNDALTRIQEDKKTGTVRGWAHLQRDIARADHFPGRLRNRSRGNEEAGTDQSGEGQLRGDEERPATSAEKGAPASAQETGAAETKDSGTAQAQS